jgi:hypothetical protein
LTILHTSVLHWRTSRGVENVKDADCMEHDKGGKERKVENSFFSTWGMITRSRRDESNSVRHDYTAFQCEYKGMQVPTAVGDEQQYHLARKLQREQSQRL